MALAVMHRENAEHLLRDVDYQVDIMFVSPDSFSGTYGVGNTYGDCSADSCHAHFAITGKRME